MKYKNYIKLIIYPLSCALILFGCRQEFQSEIELPPIVNQPPSIADINDLTLIPGFGTYELDLATYVYDQEGDVVTYQIVNSNEDVIATDLDNSLITMTEVGLGTTTLQLTASDGIEGRNSTVTFEVTIAPILGAPDVETDYLMFDFNGLGDQDLYQFDIPGMVMEKADYDWNGANIGENIIVNDHALFTIDVEQSQIWFEAEFENGNEDLTGKKMRLDYKFYTGPALSGTDLDSDPDGKDIYFYYVDETWGEVGALYLLSNENLTFSTDWQTLEIPLSDFQSMWDLPVDPSAVGTIGMHWYGGSASAPLSMRVDNFGIVD